MIPLLLKQENSEPEKKLYIVSFLADYSSLGRTTKEIFNVLVFAASDFEAKKSASDFMDDKYANSSLVGDWTISEAALIPPDYITYAYKYLPTTTN